MNHSRLQALERGQTGIARKVLEATPIQEPWNVGQIAAELIRRYGTRVETRVVHGALNNMAEQGLLKEPAPNHYQRVTLKPKLTVHTNETEDTMATIQSVKAPPTPVEPMDQIAAVASQLRQMAAKLTEAAADLDAVAIETEERIQAAQQGAAKLRQFQALLKSLGTES
jgi:hypothetical protein